MSYAITPQGIKAMKQQIITEGKAYVDRVYEYTKENMRPVIEHGGVIEIDGIEWFVLDIDSSTHTAELITKGDVTTGTYNDSTSGWQWSTSRIYNWLNEDWYNGRSAELKNMIVAQTKPTNLPNNALTTNGDETKSNVYLLSYSEYETYNAQYEEDLYSTGSASHWWLRSPVNNTNYNSAHFVYRSSGDINYSFVNATRGVRPVITIDLTKL